MSFHWGISDCLGLIYVCCWSISMYPPLWTNWKQRSANALSIDFVILNSAGYFYLIVSLILQLYCWLPPLPGQSTQDAMFLRPKVTNFDFCYSLHGLLLNIVLVSQLTMGQLIWGFRKDRSLRMKPVYFRILFLSLIIFNGLTFQFAIQNFTIGWDNSRTLTYSNRLFALKISMSLLKYIPQVVYNYERRSLKGFAIQSTMLDTIGGIASLLQLALQISHDKGLTTSVFIVNFGKIGLAMVTVLFNFIFISQWMIYRERPITQD